MSGAWIIEAIVSLLVLAGAVFTLAGSVALVRFPDFFLRLHGPTKAATTGVGTLLLASALFFSWTGASVHVEEVLIMLFLFLTAPVSAHLLAKAILHLRASGQSGLPRKRPDDPGWSAAPLRHRGSSDDVE